MTNTTNERIIVDIPIFEGTNDTNYNLILHNDEVTPMEYVVIVLSAIFGKDQNEGAKIMLHAHHNGKAVIDTVDYNSGKNKIDALEVMNAMFGLDLKVTMEQN